MTHTIKVSHDIDNGNTSNYMNTNDNDNNSIYSNNYKINNTKLKKERNKKRTNIIVEKITKINSSIYKEIKISNTIKTGMRNNNNQENENNIENGIRNNTGLRNHSRSIIISDSLKSGETRKPTVLKNTIAPTANIHNKIHSNSISDAQENKGEIIVSTTNKHKQNNNIGKLKYCEITN